MTRERTQRHSQLLATIRVPAARLGQKRLAVAVLLQEVDERLEGVDVVRDAVVVGTAVVGVEVLVDWGRRVRRGRTVRGGGKVRQKTMEEMRQKPMNDCVDVVDKVAHHRR